jgi:superoxide dismutase, Fe-Mn family
MSKSMTRRDILTHSVPALALAGVMGGGYTAFAQPEGDRRGAGQRGGREPLIMSMLRQGYSDGEYRLPKLPYAHNALEPHIDEQTMRLHHERHHQAYVNNLNSALKAAQQIGQNEDLDAQKVAGLQRDLSFNAGGHVLHSIFWATMAPDSGGQPQGPIAEGLKRQFGSFDAFRRYFSRVATSLKGSGWAVLVYEPMGDNLIVNAAGDQDLRLIPGGMPLLPLDVWEHAYYLRYQNERAKYIEAWWNVVNWSAVNEVYSVLRQRYERD